MAGAPWTDDEKQDCLALDYEEFRELHPHRGWNSYRFKRARLIEQQTRATPDDTAPEPLASPRPEPRQADWEALFASLENAEVARSRLSPTDEVAHVTAPDPLSFGVAFMSDIHAGAQGVDYPRFARDLATIADTDGLGVIVNGDLWENAKHMSKAGSALYHGLFNSPREQFYYTLTRFTPIRDKILAIAGGNHDARDGQAGIDRLPDLCQRLGTVYFSERGGTLYLTVGQQEYVIVVKHQYGGQSKINKSNSARRMWTEWPHAWESADVIALAHLHEPDLHQTMQRGRDVVWLRSGTFKTHDEWAESRGYKPSYGVPIVVFSPSARKMIPFADFEAGVRYLRMARAGERGRQQAA